MNKLVNQDKGLSVSDLIDSGDSKGLSPKDLVGPMNRQNSRPGLDLLKQEKAITKRTNNGINVLNLK